MTREAYLALAGASVAAHLAFIVWVIAGAAVTRGRPRLAAAHIASFAYGALIENVSWPCPLTLAETWCETRAGVAAYRGAFLLHALEAAVYPEVPAWVLGAGGIVVALVNLAIYLRRYRRHRASRRCPEARET